MWAKYLVCPRCSSELLDESQDSLSFRCNNGHEYHQSNSGVLDLLPLTFDKNILDEQQHWDSVSSKGKMTLVPSIHIRKKMFSVYSNLYKEIIVNELPNYSNKTVSIAEIGCGSGSAASYLSSIQFHNIEYIGIDVSIRTLEFAAKRELPSNWNSRFIRASANEGIFKKDSLDIIFCTAALHHLNIDSTIKWISASLRPNGIFILNEPSSRNPFATIGRRIIHDFHTAGEKPLKPSDINNIACNYNLQLKYEKGKDFLTGPISYLMGILKLPKVMVLCFYHTTHLIDLFIRSPSLNYSFVQVYKK
jgi:SAM-dependent methyltransferase